MVALSRDFTQAVRGPRRSEQLRIVLDHERPVFDARPGLPPGGRAECRGGERPCVYVRCEWHLWREDPENKQGRPWWKSPPQNAQKQSYERQTKLELRPEWMAPANAPDGLSIKLIARFYRAPSCGLDIVEAAQGHVVSTNEVALAIGRHPTLVRRIVRGAVGKIKAKGVRVDEFIEAMGCKP